MTRLWASVLLIGAILLLSASYHRALKLALSSLKTHAYKVSLSDK
jgi:hypothetical protein